MGLCSRAGYDIESGNKTHLLGQERKDYATTASYCTYIITVLGEIPDQDAALREVRRVLRPGGRLVVGELIGDPHMVGFGTLCKRAETIGLCYGLRLGGWLGYLARFVKITGAGATP